MSTTVDKLLIRLQKFSSKISKVIDATESFNQAGNYYQDLSGWDSAVVQIINPSEEITFNTSNDDDSATGQLLPAPEVPTNWTLVLGVDLATKTDVSAVSADAMVEFGIIGKYLQIAGTPNDPLSYAYVLSQNTYTSAQEAYDLGILQGTRIVYAAANALLTGAVILYSDSRLTQPIYGDGASWYGIALLSNKATLYAINIDEAGDIVVD